MTHIMTSLKHKSVKNFSVIPCARHTIDAFIEHWHYSKNVNGIKTDYCFKLCDGTTMIGAMMYGKLSMAEVWKKYVDEEKDLLELRRLCCIDDTPKNTESYFIGATLKWLKKNTFVKKIISYADTTYNHEGTIYKATNFKHLGFTQAGKVISYNDKLYHDKTIRTKYRGKLKPFALKILNALKSGKAKYINTKPKHIYLINISRKKNFVPNNYQYGLL